MVLNQAKLRRNYYGEPLRINFCTLTSAEMHPICTLRTFCNPLRTLWLNPNYFNRKGRKDYAKDAKNLFLEVPYESLHDVLCPLPH